VTLRGISNIEGILSDFFWAMNCIVEKDLLSSSSAACSSCGLQGEGQKNNGLDVLFQNMKYGITTTKELTEFVRER
jgi:hypothetical protein